MTTVLTPASPLTAADRCDRCGAQAYLRVVLSSGGELLFCAHHAREHGEKLREAFDRATLDTSYAIPAKSLAELQRAGIRPKQRSLADSAVEVFRSLWGGGKRK